jgi:hypothetical protein
LCVAAASAWDVVINRHRIGAGTQVVDKGILRRPRDVARSAPLTGR